MALNTNLPIPVFNVLKYLLLTLAIDILVRGGLDSFEHFCRRLLLYFGQSVPFEPVRIDRYNLLHKLRIRHFASSLILLFITLAAYSVEIGLEFATDSTLTIFPVAGQVTRLNFTRGVCSLDTIIYRTNANRLARLAEECVVHENGKYKLYRPIWVTSADDAFQPLCEPTRGNLLYESDEIYAAFEGQGEHAAREVSELDKTMKANSYKSNGDKERSFVTVNITSRDILGKFPYEFASDRFTTAVFVHRLRDSAVKCFGSVYGRHGEGMMRVMMIACTNGFTTNGSLAYAQGTGLVEMDVQDMGKQWSTLVAVESRRRLYQFAKGVTDEQQTNIVAYAVFLALSRAQEKINVNKYAIAYRNCAKLSLPSPDGGQWTEVIEAAHSEMRGTATVELWAIIVVACWVVVVTAARFVVHGLADRKGMPKRLFGEQEMLCLWLQEKDRRKELELGEDCVPRCKRVFLSVEEGSFQDSVTATKQARDVRRDRMKSFG